MDGNSSTGGSSVTQWGGEEPLFRAVGGDDDFMDLDDSYDILTADGGSGILCKTQHANEPSVSVAPPATNTHDPSAATTALVPHHAPQQVPFSGFRRLPGPLANHMWEHRPGDCSGFPSNAASSSLVPNIYDRWGTSSNTSSLTVGGALPLAAFAGGDPASYPADGLPSINMMGFPTPTHDLHNTATDYTSGSSPYGLYSGSFSSMAASDVMDTTGLTEDPSNTWSPTSSRHHSHSLSTGSGFDGPSSASPWASSTNNSLLAPTTVSPKQLRIVPTPTPTPSTESVNNSFTAAREEDTVSQASTQTRESRASSQTHEPLPTPTVHVHAPKPVRPRKQLPSARLNLLNAGKTSRRRTKAVKVPDMKVTTTKPTPTLESIVDIESRSAPTSPAPASTYSSSSEYRVTKSKSKRKTKTKSGRTITRKNIAAMKKAVEQTTVRAESPVIPTPVARSISPPPAAAEFRAPPPATDPSPSPEDRRSEKDAFLIEKRKAGMTYKKIRALGHFTEAESTLRGRFRTLTKTKEERVRKPEWEAEDDRLLKKAIKKMGKGEKIPWKRVAEYIADNGGSYHFGNTTCRKRWDMICGRDPQ